MTNPYYNHGSYPAPNSAGASASMRSELDAITAGFNKLPGTLTANGVIFVNASGTALEARSGIDGVVIGGTTPAAGTFTTLSATTVTLSSGFILPLGTVGSPSLSFTGDSNNGWWSPGADIQAWSIAGAEAMRLNSTGLGLGGSPSVKRLTLGNSTGATEQIRFRNTTADMDVGMTATGMEFSTANNVPFIWTNNAATRMTLDTSGQLGLGMTPNAILSVRKNSSAASESSAGIYITSGTGAGTVGIQLGADQTQAFGYVQTLEPTVSFSTKPLVLMPNGGNVGVGGAPSKLLHVIGNGVGVIRIQNTGASGRSWDLNSFISGVGNAGFELYDATASASRIAVDASGNIGFGINAPSGTNYHFKGSAVTMAKFETTTARGSGSVVIGLSDPSGSKGYFGYGSANDTLQVYNGLGGIDFYANGASTVAVAASGVLALSRQGVGLQHSVAFSGGVVELDLINTSNTANSQSSLFMQVAGASAGDNFIRMNINGVTDWAFGTDNSDADAFVFAASSSLGSGNIFKLGTGGVVDVVGGSGKLNMAGANTRFESAEQTCPTTNNTTGTLAHSGPRAPDHVQWVLRCKTAELGYSIGDEYNLTFMDAGVNDRILSTWQNATNVGYQWIMGTNLAPAIRNKTTTTLSTVTAANWRLVAYAHWL